MVEKKAFNVFYHVNYCMICRRNFVAINIKNVLLFGFLVF